MKAPMLQGPDRVIYVAKPDAVYRCVRMGTVFRLNRRLYPIGSWLVKAPDDDYAQPLTVAEFAAWREQETAA